MACPITKSAHKELTRRFFIDQGYLYEDLLDRWESVGENASLSEPSEQALRLRGFYVVETAHRLIDFRASSDTWDRLSSWALHRYPRSTEGLNRFIQDCTKVHRKLLVDQGEIRLMEGNSFSCQAACDRIEGAMQVLSLCQQAGGVLRARLLGGTHGFNQLGSLFGEALVNAKLSAEACIPYLETLLMIDIHNPVSPYNDVDI